MGMPRKKRKLSISSAINLHGYQLVFGLFAKLSPPRPRSISLNSQNRVLVFSSAGLGDSLLDSIAIRALAETFPGICIEAVVHHRRPHIAQHNPFLQRIHLLRKGPHAFFKLWRNLKGRGPWDAILYFSCHDPEARSLGYLLNRHVTVGLPWRSEMNELCAWNLAHPGLQRAHLAEQALRVAAQAGAKTDYPRMVYQVLPEDYSALDKKLMELRMPAAPAVVLQLGGGGAAYRDWPVEHFVKLTELLHGAGIGPIFLLGGPDHRAKAEIFTKIANSTGLPFYDLVGKLPLPLAAALLAKSRCLVSTDTGIMHLGFALGTSTVALLHCSPGPNRVGPLADQDKHAIFALPRPPGYRRPEDASMVTILPSTIFPAVQRFAQFL